MLLRFVVLLGICTVIGCGHDPANEGTSEQETGEMRNVEISLGGEPRSLPFKIVAIYESQEPSEAPPFHADEGEWLYFDCETTDDAKAPFTVGVVDVRSDSGSVHWGRAIIVVADRETGAKLTELFSKAFGGTLPPPRDPSYTPEPLVMNTAILGDDMVGHPSGGFSGQGGGWTATKWFLTDEGHEGEIYFNYNLAERLGAFSEKDADYADDLMTILASALRDGPKPERTPEDDPNLTLDAPVIGQPQKLLSRSSGFSSFTPASHFAVYENGPAVFALPLEAPDAAPVEVARFEHSLWDIQLLNDDLDMIASEGVPETPGTMSLTDPVRIWWVDHTDKQPMLLRGPERGLSLADAAVSPDLRYVGFERWQGKPGAKDRREVLTILDRELGTEKDFDLGDQSLSVTGWENTPKGHRAVIVTNRWRIDENEPSKLYLADPATGTLTLQEEEPSGSPYDHLSPDKKHRLQIGENDLTVIDIETDFKRTFVFHEDDQQFVGEDCVEWASSRYLKFNGQKLALIDVTTMKMCFPKTADGARPAAYSCRFSPDFRWVLYEGDDENEGLFLAPVELPEQAEEAK